MREDHQELLETMFPKGYLIVYVKPNDEPQLAWYNPHNDPVFNALNELILGEIDYWEEGFN